jgi:erythronate-4-phosphate dehydrogenase
LTSKVISIRTGPNQPDPHPGRPCGPPGRLRIVADAAIPLLEDAFGPLGDLLALPADRITAEAVRQADALLVRSVTRVGAALLAASRVRFVATATIGVDHVDLGYLESRGIGFASAEGSNARSVAEYVVAALAVLAERGRWRLRDKRLGIVGCGRIGGLVARMAEAIGMRVLRSDPPLERRTGGQGFVPIEAMAEADILTFHVPLTYVGTDATHHMIGARLLAGLKDGAAVINTSRGAVADTAALKEAFGGGGRLGDLVLDVWEGEPDLDPDLLDRTTLATPHVAGYSYDGKVNGTRMVLEALCRHFGLRRPWDPSPSMPPAPRPEVRLPAGVGMDLALRLATAAAYDIEADDRRLRAIGREPPLRAVWPERRGRRFTALRAEYPVRREFRETRVVLDAADADVAAALEALGFPVVGHPAGGTAGKDAR